MPETVSHLYRRINDRLSFCFNIETTGPLTAEEARCLRLILADGFRADTITDAPQDSGQTVVEIGPRLNFATAWSANMLAICRSVGLDMVSRVERSRRYVVPAGEDLAAFAAARHDRMTECVYAEPLASFAHKAQPEPVYEVDLIGRGKEVLAEIPGLSMDEWDRQLYYDYFVGHARRNPTIVELMDLNNANSEHSRHSFFRGRQVIDGKAHEQSLFDLVKGTLAANPRGSLVAFKDNSSVIQGRKIQTLVAEQPGQPSAIAMRSVEQHPLLTAETHNFPTGVAPFPGAETGTGGRIRDVQGTGRGGTVMAGTAGYCVAGLHIPGYALPWEPALPCPDTLAPALTIAIEASNGASDYGNKFGEPLIQGFVRSFDMRLKGQGAGQGERWGFLKPIMFTGGIGQIDGLHTEKKRPLAGMRIVQVGGPAYRVGFGGGAASSMLQGENESALDFDAVQRGDAEMEQKMNRVIRACIEMGAESLIEVIHDQGAGGPANVLKELVESAGGRVEIRKIHVGDPSMSVLEIYVAEYQERVGMLIQPENLPALQAICAREKVVCEDLGEVTGDLRFIVHDSQNNTTPVNLELDRLLGHLPQKTYTDETRLEPPAPLVLPAKLSPKEALERVLRLLSVGSKRFLTNKVDRSVSGLVAQQQCCGPLQLTVADCAVVAQSHFELFGIATAIGEQPVKMLVNPAAGARMALAEALTNLVWAKIDDPLQIKCSANWMWAPKLRGEGAALRQAAEAMAAAMIALGVAVDGGKDSLSMATKVGGEVVKSPRDLVISLYAAMSDLRQKVTPDLKSTDSVLLLVDVAPGQHRLGGSALAQCFGQESLGDEVPDLDSPALLKRAFLAVQDLIAEGLILSGHDRSEGGLITTVLEMAFAGNCGLRLALQGGEAEALATLFAEELGLVLECSWQHLPEVKKRLAEAEVPLVVLGQTTPDRIVNVLYNGRPVLDESLVLLRQWWEETSYRLERLQVNPDCAEEERLNCLDRPGPGYHLPFTPQPTALSVLQAADKPRVAILRDEGSNSDREMAAAFYSAGFEPWDITMTDLLAGRVRLDGFRGLAAVGGFSYADVPESAKGWASTIVFNDALHREFQSFYQRPNTFTFGSCNGCQLFALLGWVPWQGLDAEAQPRFVRNVSGRFESRWSTVRVQKSPAIMLRGMDGLIFGIHVDHGEGRLVFPDALVRERVRVEGLAPLVYVDDSGRATEDYPFNPNGSGDGLAGLCSPDGRHLALMPHAERCFLPWQAHWLPQHMKDLAVSPWLRMFQNAYHWCMERR